MGEAKKSAGCGVFAAMFCRRASNRHRRAASTSALPPRSAPAKPDPKPAKRRAGSVDTSIVIRPVNNQVAVPATAQPFKPRPLIPNPRNLSRIQPGQVKAITAAVPAPAPGNGISGELENLLYDYQMAKGNSKMVRATSGNVMVYGHLGNIRSNQSSIKDPKNSYKPVANRASHADTDPGPQALCPASPKRMDPEQLKELGNKEFSKGRFSEALALYDQAAALDPGKASYRSNKAAALTGLGRVLEAAVECKEAVRLDPAYYRAHTRLASLYFRLGEAGKAIQHYKQAQQEADASDISKGQALQRHIALCSEARRTRDWHTMLKESRAATVAGADSAPQVTAWQAEALIKLHKHDEADEVLASAFDVDVALKVLAAPVVAYILMVHALVHMAVGRFDEAVAAAQGAARLDNGSGGREAGAVLRTARAVASARSKGNEMFKASKFREASLAYGGGLDHDPGNAVLLCNRAASRSRLGQWEKALEDCDAALRVRPCYTKARVRRANCNAKMRRWAAAVQDYEVLVIEMEGDEDVSRGLAEAKAMVQKRVSRDIARSTTHS